ncbi:hypothetical protein PQX77_007666 [Marasmius sp. AFHP31]|nr:hypothetical protein PQX77_007666 [Marasmius sp. AFHP31]
MPNELTYVIEHMEDDDEVSKTVPPWVDLEYAHMRTLAGPKSRVLFTNLSKVSAESLENKFKSSASSSTSENLAEVSCRTAGILDLIKEELGGSLEKVCLLDPKAEKEISPEDGDGRFEWFLFGVSDLSYIFHEERASASKVIREYWVMIRLEIEQVNFACSDFLAVIWDLFK